MSGMKRGLHSVSGLFAFTLIGLFALGALMIIVSGIQSYRGMGRANLLSSQERVALGYVSGKLRASGDRGGVSIREERGVKLLVLSEREGGVDYETRVFFAGGSLREQFCEAGLEFDPEYGEPVASLPGFSFERAGDLVQLKAVLSDGTEAGACVALRAGEEGGRDAL